MRPELLPFTERTGPLDNAADAVLCRTAGKTFVGLSHGLPNAITGLIANDRKIEGRIRPFEERAIIEFRGSLFLSDVRRSLIVLYLPSRRMTPLVDATRAIT